MKHIRNAVTGATVTLFLMLTYGAWVSGRQISDVPGSMQLMPGYRHEAGHSIDTAVGRIWRDGGPELTYEIGLHARNELALHRLNNDLLWVKTIERDGTKVEVALSKDGRTLFATMNGGFQCFEARNVVSAGDTADVLLMLSTFDVRLPPRRR